MIFFQIVSGSMFLSTTIYLSYLVSSELNIALLLCKRISLTFCMNLHRHLEIMIQTTLLRESLRSLAFLQFSPIAISQR